MLSRIVSPPPRPIQALIQKQRSKVKEGKERLHLEIRHGMEYSTRGEKRQGKTDGLVKSPAVPLGAGLRFNFVVAAYLCTLHSSVFARPVPPRAGELFTKPSKSIRSELLDFRLTDEQKIIQETARFDGNPRIIRERRIRFPKEGMENS